MRGGARGWSRRALLGSLLCSLVLALPVHAARTVTTRACPPSATAPTAEDVEVGMLTARDRGFLWQAEKDGRRSYLYGTLHIGHPAWVFPGPQVTQALAGSDTVALELDLADPAMRRRTIDAMVLPATPRWPAALVQRLRRQLRAECIDSQAVRRGGPELQLATLSMLSARRDGLDPAYGIDLALAGVGHNTHKSVISLETPERQLRAMRSPNRRDALALVRSGLNELEAGRMRRAVVRIAQVWADADHATLARYEDWCNCRRGGSDRAAMKRLLDERNPALADAIDALHARGQRVFAAVGSLHMVGPNGLPALLAERGYTVEPVVFGR